MKHKDLKLEFKSIGDEGAFTGYAAVFNNIDLGGDIIAPGAFSKTIQEKRDHPVLLGHNPREVIGVNKSYTEDAKGLLVEGQLVLGVQKAKETHELMKAGAIKGMSIGYDVVTDEYNRETDVRTLKEVKLWEYSFTPFPMNPEASVLAVKSIEEWETEMRSIMRFAAKQKGPLSESMIKLLDDTISALQAAKALGAATQEDVAPGSIHAMFR
jgi:HK97 family phage prohead protease